MHIHFPHSFRKNAKLIALSALSMSLSFLIGIESAGEIQPVTLISAGGTEVAGDMNGSGNIDIEDVITILEVVQGYRTATTAELKLDPNGDGALTIDDALRILSTLR